MLFARDEQVSVMMRCGSMIENPILQDANDDQTGMPLSLEDLLADEQANMLSDYLSLSIVPLGEDTRISVTTTDTEPTIYSSILYGVPSLDLQMLVLDAQTINSDSDS
jgi:hypothetical protein